MTRARCLTHAALAEVRQALKVAESASAFLDLAHPIVQGSATTMNFPYSSSDLPDIETPGPRGDTEVRAAILLHEALRPMPRSAAGDPRLWTYLALGPFQPYMSRRWPLSGLESWRNRVQDRWVLTSATAGRLVRHGIARLWWLAELTRDPNLEHKLSRETDDEWAYTKVALAKEDRVMALFDREIGSMPVLRFAVLDQVHAWGAEATEARLRSLMKELNLLDGFRDLAWFDEDAAKAALREAGESQN